MKIGIRKKGDFSLCWIDYCKTHRIPYKIISCYDNNIIEQLEDCDAFMWQHHQTRFKDTLFAKQLLYSLEQAGTKVFPDFNTGWHFDDKVGQKYILEAIEAPLAPTYVFYDKVSARRWVEQTDFPMVFKLRGGAHADNVSLVKTRQSARKKINRAFGPGFSPYNGWGNFKERYRRFREGKSSFLSVIKGLARIFISTDFAKMYGREKGYVYFQEFIPDNDCDYRIKVIGQKAWGCIRKVRENDFRASGNNDLIFDHNQIPLEIVETALWIAKRLKLQSVAFDFVLDKDKNPLLLEMSYGFGTVENEFDFGYWDSGLNWHEGKFNPIEWIIEDLIKSINQGD